MAPGLLFSGKAVIPVSPPLLVSHPISPLIQSAKITDIPVPHADQFRRGFGTAFSSAAVNQHFGIQIGNDSGGKLANLLFRQQNTARDMGFLILRLGTDVQ